MTRETFNLPYAGTTVTGNGATGNAVARAMVERDRSLAQQEREWVAALRHIGVKAAHPDDGWVNRETNEVSLCYPQFNDGLTVGSRLALGWGEIFRIVTITARRDSPLGLTYWQFAAAPAERGQ